MLLMSNQTFVCFQPYKKFVEVGRVAYNAFGSDKGKLCTIVDVIDENRVSSTKLVNKGFTRLYIIL